MSDNAPTSRTPGLVVEWQSCKHLEKGLVLKEPQRIEGRWHIFGDDKPPHFGTLVCDPVKGLSLEVKELREDEIQAVLKQRFERVGTAGEMQGFGSNNQAIRLAGSFAAGGSGRMGLKTHHFFVKRGVTNWTGGKWTDLQSRSFQLRFSMLHSWMDRRISVKDDNERPADIRIEVRQGLAATLGLIIHSSSTRTHYQVNHDSWIGLEFSDDQNVWRVRSKETLALALFLSLLIGDPVALDDFAFLETGASEVGPDVVEHRLLEPRGYAPHTRESKDYWHMRATFPMVQDRIDKMLRRWLSFFDDSDMRAVLDLYAAVVYSELYDTARFLILAQALEAYHTASGKFTGTAMPSAQFAQLSVRVKAALTKEDFAILRDRFIFANQKTFVQKLEEVVLSAPSQVGGIITDLGDFAKVVKDLRNAYTHHVGETAHQNRRRHERKIPFLAEQARCLLEMLLLAELDAPSQSLDQIVREHKTAVRIDLGDPEC